MKILLLGWPVLQRAFMQGGHDVVTCTTDQQGDIWIEAFPVPIEEVLEKLPLQWDPDLIVLMDESTEPMFLGLESLDIPLAWYTIDAHLHLHWHRDYAAVFDFVFVAQRDYLPDYTVDLQRQVVTWLPLFSNPDVDRYAVLDKIYDLSFVGAINFRWKPERSRFLEEVSHRIPLYTTSGEYVSVFNRSKVVLNECAANDVNFRVFEALGCGSFLLTERVGNGFEELFEDRHHLAMFQRGNIDQIVELAHYYASHKQEREAIAYEGRQLVLAAHTTLHRAETIVQTIHAADVQALILSRQSKLQEMYPLLGRVYEHAVGVYELASRNYQYSPHKYRECVRTAEIYQQARSKVVQETNVEIAHLDVTKV